MIGQRKNPIIQAIVPNVQDYLQNVQQFYTEKIALVMHKITQFKEIAVQLTQIPEHLALQFSYVKTMPKVSQQEKELERLMVQDQIQKFINLKNEVIQYQTGNKYLYPQLPKIQRNVSRRRGSKSSQFSSDSQKNDNLDSKQSVNEICNLLGTLNLQSKTNQQICQSIQNMVAQMNLLDLKDGCESTKETKYHQKSTQHLKQENCQTSMTQVDQRAMQLQRIRQSKKVQLFRFQNRLNEDQQQGVQSNYPQVYRERLIQIKQLFKTHLQKSVQQVLRRIEQILLKALKDIKNHDKAYVPIHKISSYFYKLNLKFYRTQGVVRCLYKYLTKKIKQCVMDSIQTFIHNGQEIKIKTNFRLRFFKHILIQNIFSIWLKHAVIDLNKMQKQNINFQDKKPVSSPKIQCQHSQKQMNDANQHISHEQATEMFSQRKNNHSFDNFIM